MGDLLFNRKVSLIITKPVKGYREIGDLVLEVTLQRVAFKVEKSLKKEPNTCEVTVTNLSAASRALLATAGGKFVISAGYESGIEQLFIGDIRNVAHERKKADWETVIKSGDGERAYRFARVNESFKAGTPVGDVLKKIGGALGLDIGNLSTEAGNLSAQYVNGFAAHGSAQVELDRILRVQGFTWSIQDGAIQVLKNDASGALLIPDLSPDTGLVDSPTFGAAEKNKGPVIKGKALLMPKIKPGGRVHLNSERFKGDIRVTKVSHNGDTHGGEWYTEFEGEPT